MSGVIRTPSTLLIRGRAVFTESDIHTSEYEKRIAKIQKLIKAQKIGALIVGGEAFDQASYTYVTGYLATVWWPGRTNYVVIPQNQGPIMIASAGPRDLPFLKTQTWIQNIRPAKNLITEAANVTKSLSPRVKKIGLAWISQSKKADDYRTLRSNLPNLKFVQMNDRLEDLRKIKSENEISLVRKACRALDLEHETLLRNLKPGITECEVEAKADRMARLEGARDLRMLWSIGHEGHPILIPSRERELSKEDHVSWFGAVEYAGYWAEVGRVFSLGEPTPALANMHNAANVALEIGVKTIKPGVKLSKVHDEIQRSLKASSYDGSIQTDYGFGHAIGLDRAEKPFITHASNELIKSGMIFSLRIPLHKSREASVLIGDTILVTEDGNERLTRSSQDLVTIRE